MVLKNSELKTLRSLFKILKRICTIFSFKHFLNVGKKMRLQVATSNSFFDIIQAT
jgi:hypothetical protein